MKLENIIKDKARLLIGENIPKEYYEDIYIPELKKPYAIAKAIDEEEVIELVKFANENNLVMIARGGGTGVSGSQVTKLGNELIIDVSLMNKIIEFDEETLTLTVEPGVFIHDVQAHVDDLGYMYPPDPGSKYSTIGGNIATNAGGMRAIKYGTTRNYVKEIDIVLPTGKKTTLGSLNVKSSSGYNLKDLIIGSEGTLGIITKAKIKVVPKPKFSKSMILAFEDAFAATAAVLNILKQGYVPTALELFDRELIQFSEEFSKAKFASSLGSAYVLLTLDGNDEENIKNNLELIKKDSKTHALEAIILSDEEAKLAWTLRDNILYALYSFAIFEMLDEVVPINKFAEIIKFTKSLEKKYNINVYNFGHAGDGNVHTILMHTKLSKEEWEAIRTPLLDDIYCEVKRLGGLPSAEHGIGLLKKDYFLKLTDPIKVDMMRAIKSSIDPKGLLNPGKIF